MNRLAAVAAAWLLLSAPAFAAGGSTLGGTVSLPSVTSGTPTAALCKDSSGNIVTNGASANCFAGVTAAGNNTFTGNNIFQTGTLQFRQDPTISSGGSATTGAMFFGTNLGTQFVGYDPTTGGTGGYSLGNTFSTSDALYVGPIHLNNGLSGEVTLNAGGSGAWNLTFPTTAGSSGQVMQSNGSGTMSWLTPGTITNVTAGTGLSGGGSSGSVTLNANTATTGAAGIITLASAAIACAGASTTTALTPASLAATTNYFCMPGGVYFEYGNGVSDGGGNISLTLPHALTSGVISIIGQAGGQNITEWSGCTTTTCSGVTANTSTGAPTPSTNYWWIVVGK